MDREPTPPGTGGSLRLAPGGEFDLIRRFYAAVPPAPRDDVRLGPGDDCAVVSGDGIALSSDMSVEGVHFRRDWLTPHEIGYRAAAAALSDLAAVAARPIGVLVSVAAPAAAAEDVVAVMEGVADIVGRLGGAVLGGDLTRTSGPMVIDVTVVGEAPAPVRRDGARPGDEVWVTGELGGAGLAVRRLLAGADPGPGARKRFAAPEPRTREALWLRDRARPTAMIDLSDGIGGDAAHIAAASGVAVVLEAEALPAHPALGEGGIAPEEALGLALGGGEDYELCFTAAPGSVGPRVEEFVGRFGVRLTRVGRVEAGEGVLIDRGGGGAPTRLRLAGFQHFGGDG